MKAIIFCSGCMKKLRTFRPDGTVYQEGWYEFDGMELCTECWQSTYYKKMREKL